jgi:hypothetical protein
MSGFIGSASAQDPAFFERFDLPETLRATASRMSALKADSSNIAASWMSIAPSVHSPAGSGAQPPREQRATPRDRIGGMHLRHVRAVIDRESRHAR